MSEEHENESPAGEAQAAAGNATQSAPGAAETVAPCGAGTLRQLAGNTDSDMNLDTLLKVPVSLSIQVGSTRMPLNELLKTQEGSVIELERLLDEPLDILVNGALIAHGVVVLAKERFGIQITDIVSQQERAEML